jgi:DNA-directed RNA polymerase subunit RPC12/RpoP
MKNCIYCKKEFSKKEKALYLISGTIDGQRYKGFACEYHEKIMYKDSNERQKTSLLNEK